MNWEEKSRTCGETHLVPSQKQDQSALKCFFTHALHTHAGI